MGRRELAVWVGAPGTLLAATALVAVVASPWWYFALLVALLTAPLWSLAGLRRAPAAGALIASFNVQCAAILAVATSAVLMLVFIGALLMIVVILAEISWSLDAARRAWFNQLPVMPAGACVFKKPPLPGSLH